MTTPHPRTLSRFARPLLIGTLGMFGILVGFVPDLAASQPSAVFATIARADDFGDADLRKFAAALVQIEPIRQSTLDRVSRVNGGNLPNLVCNQPSSMDGLNQEAKSLFIRYCNQCESIAASKGLSIDRFNQIAQAVRANSALQTKVRNLMN
jgi:hypothetical protein